MKRSFFDRHALLILMIVFFFVPFGMRGARMAVNNMRNEVKDWLPDSFAETKELEIFRKHFWGEGFIVVSWDDCTGALDDQRFRLFVDKFFPDLPPSQRQDAPAAEPSQFVDEDLQMYVRRLDADTPDSVRDVIGNRFGLYSTGNYFENWGGQNEKWLRGDGKKWFYITPDGNLYQWEGADTLLMATARSVRRKLNGPTTLEGKLVERLGLQDGAWYHEQPRRLEADMFKSVLTGPALLSQLTGKGGALEGDPEAAIDRLQGWLFGPDGKQTCMVVTLSNRGRKHIHRAVGRGLLGKPQGKIFQMAAECGIRVPQAPSALPPLIDRLFEKPVATAGPMIRMGGPPVDNVAIDEEGQSTLVRLAGLSAVLGLLISWLSFRNVPIVIMLSFVGFISAIASLGFIWWGGSTLDAVLMSMPSLVYVLGLSGAVHIVNYYRDTVETDGYPGNPTKAIALGWKPCTLAAITTGLGLISLATSNIVPIRKFGIFSAIGVVFTLILLFTFLPAALSLWPPKDFGSKDGKKSSRNRNSFNELCTRFWKRIGYFVVRRHGLVSIVCLVVLLVMALGLPRMKTSVQLLKLFDHESKIIKDYTWLEKKLGKLVPMELLVWIKPDAMRNSELSEIKGSAPEAIVDDATNELADRYGLNFLERMELTEYIRRSIDAHFGPGNGDITGTAMMASTFVPPRPSSGGSTISGMMRGGYSKRLANYRDDIHRSDCFRVDEETGAEIWRISLRLSALGDVDYGAFVSELKKAIEPVMAAYEYRTKILEALDAARGRARGGRVLFLGAPFGKCGEFADVPLDVPPSSFTALHGEDVTVDQSVIFSFTLHSLLRNAALGVKEWHDPRFKLPADFQQRLGQYDCVVWLEDDERYRQEDMQLANVVVDARDHYFEDREGATTALQRDRSIGTMYTGLVPIVYKAQRTLLKSLTESTGWAFLAISIVMILVLRKPTAGLISMVPNIFPVVIVFGYMGWRQVQVDIGTMMTASVAMGVAVDDTVHFLTWFRRGLDEGRDRKAAIMLAYDRCATAMTQTTLIGGLGLSVFALSTFTPTQRFGVLMLTLMVAALIGDLIFLPAILAGPAGRVFSRSRTDRKKKSEPQEVTGAAAADAVLAQREPIRMKSKRGSQDAGGIRIEGPHQRPSG